jgi:transposase
MDLTNELWSAVEKLLLVGEVRTGRRGRPWSGRRKVFNGILWILRTGAQWQDLPPRYGSYQTAHRRLQHWVRSGVLENILLALAQHLKYAGGLDLKEYFVDGTLVQAKKWGGWSARPNVAKSPKSWVLPTVMACLSPCGQKALRRRKRRWWKKPWQNALWPTCRSL